MKLPLLALILSPCLYAQTPLVDVWMVSHKVDCSAFTSTAAWSSSNFNSKALAEQYLQGVINMQTPKSCPHVVKKLVTAQTQVQVVIVDPSTSAEFLPPTECVEFCEAEWQRAGIEPYPFRVSDPLSRSRLQLLEPRPDRALARRVRNDLYALRSAWGR